MKPSIRNLLQPSTLRAVAVLAAAGGLTVDAQMIEGISTVALTLWGLYEALRDSN